MSPVSFFAGTGDPSALKRGYAVQTAENIPRLVADAIPFSCYGGVVTPSPKYIDRLQLNRRPMRGRPMGSKVDIEGLQMAMGDLDPGNHMHVAGLISLFQGYSVNTALGASRYRISQQQVEDGTEFLKKFTYFNDSDKGMAIRFVNAIIAGMTLEVSPRANAALGFNWQVGRYDFWSDDTITGTGIVKAFLRHAMSQQFDTSSSTGDIVITIVSDDATSVTFTVNVGGGGASANQTATKGVWTYIYSGTPATVPVGNRAQQIQVYFPTGANDSFVDADVHTFQSRYSLDFEDDDYPTPRPMAETQFRFFLGDNGGEVVVDNGITVNVEIPGAITRYSAGGEQPIAGDRRGRHNVTLQLNRRLVDFELQQILMQREVVPIVLESRNDTIIGTSPYYFGVAGVFPECVVEGQFHDSAEGGENFDEVLTLRAAKPTTPLNLSTLLPGGGYYSGITDVAADVEWIVDTDLDPTDLDIA